MASAPVSARAVSQLRDGTFIDNLLVQIHFIIVMIRWTSFAPQEFEFLDPGSLTSTFPVGDGTPQCFERTFRCRANPAQIRQSRLDSGLGLQVQGLKSFRVVLSWLGSGPWVYVEVRIP